MAIGLTPYLRFAGDAREAMEFYNAALGGELSMMTFQEGMNDGNPATADLIMHSSLFLERGIHLMASDSTPEMTVTSNGAVALSSDATDEADNAVLTKWWEALTAGATIEVPLEKAPWGDSFGQLRDKFGVVWMFNISAVQG
ncbi:MULTISPECIES: VOC family protein [Glutamicibacter]|jgi:PhnB protein|uniref:VOC family protein n=1 Tax=Glutamicibacter halophytocola TaxID=1933880 RepID=A0A5B8IN74_9MICC|nr:MULTISPECIES: VOC family protein [Glutamicibacter]MBF6670857.1 VOC family protein [Glutamicibacter sp. FBE19]NQD41252.1 VOC family protein [Glutamicibacter halophytocola]QDY66251.1 VOC family protein [Glutamicibacter halophytocola]UUX58352.1 VOC family protein [Glutamicibacter halophytocola]